MPDNEVIKDIEMSKKHQSINCVMVMDDKITAEFCYHEDTNPMNCYSEWISYKKIFNTWKEFSDYADLFFTTLMEMES